MTNVLRQLKLWLPLVMAAFAASSAEAGFVSIDRDSNLLNVSFSLDVSAGMSSTGSYEKEPPLRSALSEILHLGQLQAGNTTGGMSSSSSASPVGGSSAPAAILTDTTLPCQGPVSPLFLREIQFKPQLLIADIFRPPCA